MAARSSLSRAQSSRWQSVLSSWGWRKDAVPPAGQGDPQPVRDAMRGLLAGVPGRHARLLEASIAGCRDVHELYDLRAALVLAIGTTVGESQAREQLAALDAVFLRVWPQAPVSTPRRLR
jgi:hypothetical protein